MKVKQLKEWLSHFIDEADVEYSLLPSRESHWLPEYSVQLHVTIDSKPTGATLNLDEEANSEA
ncbi:hypothetical protein LCGC14_2371090 [marine sediment metagenome]|uniref:Uncharacterized protein n=1 Tax=marine sediment metagenome TaxID=412755 RepID=A0A0F9C3Q2_9ZZZZ